MNKLMQWVMIVTLICSSTVFTSCSKDDNPVNPSDDLADMIIGKWMPAEIGGQAVLTNVKSVYTFVSTTKAYISVSTQPQQDEDAVWNEQVELAVAIDGNKMTLTYDLDEQTKMVEMFNVTSINSSEFSAKHKLTVTVDGIEVLSNEGKIRFTKIKRDYKETILGTWEGQVTNSEGSAYDDGKTHRWEYKADGTYVYYSKNEAGEWVPSDNTLNEYFVDGTLLCTRWIDNGTENREWWEIVSIKNGVMKWKALRENEDGTTFVSTFEMTKVK